MTEGKPVPLDADGPVPDDNHAGLVEVAKVGDEVDEAVTPLDSATSVVDELAPETVVGLKVLALWMAPVPVLRTDDELPSG
jgi:hypothetical protein